MNTTTLDQGFAGGAEGGQINGGTNGGGGGNPLGRFAAWCYDRRRAVVALWIATLAVVTGLSFVFPGVFANKFGGGHSESQRAQDFLKAHFPTEAGDSAQVVFA